MGLRGLLPLYSSWEDGDVTSCLINVEVFLFLASCWCDSSSTYFSALNTPSIELVVVDSKLTQFIYELSPPLPSICASDNESVGKRRSENSSHYEMEAHKRPRLAGELAPHSPNLVSTSSPSYHPITPTTIQHKPHTQHQQQQQQQQQRSPIIKVIPYTSSGIYE